SSGTVRRAATRAWAMAWPPKTRPVPSSSRRPMNRSPPRASRSSNRMSSATRRSGFAVITDGFAMARSPCAAKCLASTYAGHSPQHSPCEGFGAVPSGPALRGLWIEAPLAQPCVEGAYIGLCKAPFAAPGDRQRNRGSWPVPDMVRRHDRNVDRVAFGQSEGLPMAGKLFAPRQFSRASGMIGLVNAVGREQRVTCGEDGHRLLAAKLQQVVVFGIAVVRCHRVRTRDEDEALRPQHAPGLRNDPRAKLIEQFQEKRAVGWSLFDVLEHRPTVRAFYTADGVTDAQTVAFWLPVDADRQIAAVELDRGRRERFTEVRQRAKFEQRVNVEVVPQLVGAFRVGSSKG